MELGKTNVSSICLSVLDDVPSQGPQEGRQGLREHSSRRAVTGGEVTTPKKGPGSPTETVTFFVDGVFLSGHDTGGHRSSRGDGDCVSTGPERSTGDSLCIHHGPESLVTHTWETLGTPLRQRVRRPDPTPDPET